MENKENIRPTRQALLEALTLSSELLRNIELGEIPLTQIVLKTSRLARLLNDFDYQRIMEYEVSGYVKDPNGFVLPEHWRLGVIAGRSYDWKDEKTQEILTRMDLASISQLQESLATAKTALSVAGDPDISLASTNPNQYVGIGTGIGNRIERNEIRQSVATIAEKLAQRQSFIYQYILRKHYELKFSGIADDIFSRTRQRVDDIIGRMIPEAAQKFSAVHESLLSENPENWSNAVHSCRRILQDLADALFPASSEVREKNLDSKTIKILLGKENYINRLIAYVEESSDSKRFQELVGSNLSYLGNRLDSVFQAAQKGTHEHIVSREEGDRYVIYTYLLIGDILSLRDKAKDIEQ